MGRRGLLACVCVLTAGALGFVASARAGVSGDPKHAFRAQDLRWANKIILGRADLPTGVKWNWTALGASGNTGGGSDAGCPGVRTDDSDLTETGAAGSFAVSTNRQFIIVSSVWAFRTSTEAGKFVHRLVAGMGRCGPALAKSETGASTSVRLVSYGPHTIPGTRGLRDFRLVVTLPAQGKRIKSFVDLGFVHVGRASLAVILHGAYAQIPAPVEADLVRLLMARMSHPPRSS
jgi:hypothetical protein